MTERTFGGLRTVLPIVYCVYAYSLFFAPADGGGTAAGENVLLTEWWTLSDGSEIDEPWRLAQEPDAACGCCSDPDVQTLSQQGGQQVWANATEWQSAGRLLWRSKCTGDADALVCCRRMALRCYRVAARLLSPHQSSEPKLPRGHADLLQVLYVVYTICILLYIYIYTYTYIYILYITVYYI
jgi:hypothetical protein